MDTKPCILLVDNGSHRADSTLNLRRIANDLSVDVGHKVSPVSLLHSINVDPGELGGIPARIFEPFLIEMLQKGVRSFLVVPLFFGRSAAIYEYLPERVREIKKEWPRLELRIAPPLVDVDNSSNNEVAKIIAELVKDKIQLEGLQGPAVTLVDHGTPRIKVNAVRNFIALQLEELLGEVTSVVKPSSMESREGGEYAFNKPLLENLLGSEGFDRDVIIAMLFISPGRHAGSGGDIDRICKEAEFENEDLHIYRSSLFSEHPGIIPILNRQIHQGFKSDRIKA